MMTNYAEVCRHIVAIYNLTDGKVDIDVALSSFSLNDDYGQELPRAISYYIGTFLDIACCGKRSCLVSINCYYNFEPFGFEMEKCEDSLNYKVTW